MAYRAVWMVMAAALVCGCEEQAAPQPPEKKSAPQAPASASASSVPNYKGPPLQKSVVKSAPGDGGLVTMSRVLVPTLTTADPVAVLLHWEGEGGAIGQEHPLGKQDLDRIKTIESLRVTIAGGDGAEKQLALKSSGAKSAPYPYWHVPDVLLKVDAQGVAFGPQRLVWKEGAPSFAAGKYRITIEGELALADKPIRFKSAPMDVEMRAPSADFKALADLEAAAAAHVNETRGKKPAGPSKQTLQDAEGNRVVRFRVDNEMYEALFVEVVVTPAGKVLGSAQDKIFTCIAEGTLVDTPRGARAIETLRRGDAVWSFDLEGRRRSASHVVSLVALGERPVIELSLGLRVTAEHPVWVADAWRNAGEIASGEQLVGMTGGLAAAPRAAGQSVVYDLEVASPHNFFAGGVLVHNKAGESPEARGVRLDDWENVDTRPR